MKTENKFPRQIFLRRRGLPYIAAPTIRRETRMSWVAGPGWSETKYLKRDYEMVSAAEYAEWQWATSTWSAIKDLIGVHCLNIKPAQLREIARIVGYEEAPRDAH